MQNHKQKLYELRHELHRYPELSQEEFETRKRLLQFFEQIKADEIIRFEPTAGFALVINGKQAGKTLMFRADMDALPIEERNEVPYRSKNKGKAHLCGHDGHMTIVSGLALKVAENPPSKGRVVFLFQPAEEQYQGAEQVVNHPNFKKIEPDYIFGLHNIPKVKKHEIVLKEAEFAAASIGMIIKLHGKTAHAAEPENGNSPVFAVKDMIEQFHKISENELAFSDFVLLTPVHISMGSPAFGTTPGDAVVMLTLRSYTNPDMDLLCKSLETECKKITDKYHLKYEIEYTEHFPALVNTKQCTDFIRKAAAENKLKINKRELPFRWSEDFSYFTQKYKGGFFGLGSGAKQADLHNPDYNFPDEIIETGVNMFFSVYKQILF